MLTYLFWISIQLSFQEWTQQMRDMLEARKRGDFAFRDKDFKTAIDCYAQVCFELYACIPRTWMRRSIPEKLCHNPELDLRVETWLIKLAQPNFDCRWSEVSIIDWGSVKLQSKWIIVAMLSRPCKMMVRPDFSSLLITWLWSSIVGKTPHTLNPWYLFKSFVGGCTQKFSL